MKLKTFLLLCCCLSLLFTFQAKALQETQPIIKASTVKFHGQIKSPRDFAKDSIHISVTVPLPITGTEKTYKTLIQPDGKFSLEIAVELLTSSTVIKIEMNPDHYLFFKLTAGIPNEMNVEMDKSNQIKNIISNPSMPFQDMKMPINEMEKMLAFQPDRAPFDIEIATPTEFLDYAKFALKERIDLIPDETPISKDVQKIIKNEFSVFFYHFYVVDQLGYLLESSSKNSPNGNPKKLSKEEQAIFAFLKELNLSDKQHLNSFKLSQFQNQLLDNKALNLPPLADQEISKWIKEVKLILSDLIGFDDGYYYDLLAANAYGLQMNREVQPLNDTQKQHIQAYWKNNEIAKILLNRNAEIELIASKSTPVVIHDVANIEPSKLIDNILAKYPNKVVLIDFWATWCEPCLTAMNEFRTTKNSFKDKDVVFVYLTNGSSPESLWKSTIKGIGSEHYYLSKAQWEYLEEAFDFGAIPFYLIFNKQKQFQQKFIGFPGSEAMQNMLLKLLD